MLTYDQAIISISTCQTLTNILCSIELLRFDESRQSVYILAINTRREEIEIMIDREGKKICL